LEGFGAAGVAAAGVVVVPAVLVLPPPAAVLSDAVVPDDELDAPDAALESDAGVADAFCVGVGAGAPAPAVSVVVTAAGALAGISWTTARRCSAASTADSAPVRPIAEAMISAVATADATAIAASCDRLRRTARSDRITAR
jgi:hypothetical protein